MKNFFTTIDVIAAVRELQSIVGMRVHNIYDINSKTYLIRFKEKDRKAAVLFESGIRIHLTDREWPKNQMPSSFSMKLRKHVKNSRLEAVRQLGVDRVVDLEFTDKEGSLHVIIELYDQGNILLTDAQYTILNILRPRTDKDKDVKLSVKEKYPIESARQDFPFPSLEEITASFEKAKKGDNLRRLLTPHVLFGGSLIDHVLAGAGIAANAKVDVNVKRDPETISKIYAALESGKTILEQIQNSTPTGFLTYTEETRADGTSVKAYQEYQPYPFAQTTQAPHLDFPTFSLAIDEFYAMIETQKVDQRALAKEKEAIKKLNNVRKDQETRIQGLEEAKKQQELMGERIVLNDKLVERALVVMRTLIAAQSDWAVIEQWWQQAVDSGDATAGSITKLDLMNNQFAMRLGDPFDEEAPPVEVRIDISLNAHQNSRKYFVDKKAAAVKQNKTIQASAIAIKNAQQKANQTLEMVRIRSDVMKSRKPFWFEKFVWFISSENYIVVSGRDAQQNELLVKRYLRPGDVYVHADLRGAASVIVRNKNAKNEIPPKTLVEASQMAVCCSHAWDSKVIANAWWVHHDQVSRTAPTGEYLPSGSFMIRGKKNFMPQSQLVLGFALLFKVDEDSVPRHQGERKPFTKEEAEEAAQNEEASANVAEEAVADGSDDDGADEEKKEDEEEFPDVSVPISSLKVAEAGEEYSIIEIGSKAGRAPQVKPETKKYLEEKEKQEDAATKQKREQQQAQRQRNKQKLIKKKYGDQDEEERELRLTILASRGKQPEKPVEKPKQPVVERPPKREPKPKAEAQANNEEEADDIVTFDDAVEDGTLQSLTGKPVEEDTLLFAVPVVAPYQTLTTYKYKVKLTPGTGKRGKAVKTALELFMRSTAATQRELTLIKALVGDEAAPRNVPGKVKVSAPQLYK
ncbi:unnamed protein product, partial [Mesorhabditis spiculigera]